MKEWVFCDVMMSNELIYVIFSITGDKISVQQHPT